MLSLTDWEHRGFTGGETVIFKPHMLDFWSSFDPAKGFEFKDMVSISPVSCPLHMRVNCRPHNRLRVQVSKET